MSQQVVTTQDWQCIQTAGLPAVIFLHADIKSNHSSIPPSDSLLIDVTLDNTSNQLPLCAVNFRVRFNITLREPKLDSTVEASMKNRCQNFLLETEKQVQNRLLANIKTWKSMASFSPLMILSQNKSPLVTMSLLKMYTGNLGALDAQYQAINFQEWETKDNSQAELLWAKVLNYKDSSGEQCFKDLVLIALSIFILPLAVPTLKGFLTNEPCEIQTADRMFHKTLSTILCFRYSLRRLGICCKDFVPCQEFLQCFNVVIYRDREEIGDPRDGAESERDDLF